MRVRATARARRLNEFRTTEFPLFAVTMIPTRGVSEMTRYPIKDAVATFSPWRTTRRKSSASTMRLRRASTSER